MGNTNASVLSSATLVFDDEFNSFVATPDGTVGWTTEYQFGGANARTLGGNHEAEYYSDSSVGVDPFSDSNGVLSITAAPTDPASNPDGLPYTSGAITSYNSFSEEYGYFEIRAKLPAGQGLWPAFWLISPTSWQEIDALEVLGNSPTTLYTSTHSVGADGTISSTGLASTVANTSTAFHTYGVDWEPNYITFYMDGQEVEQVTTPAAMDQAMYILLNLAVGGVGSWPGPPDSSTVFPATMQIDYVRAYATANTRDINGNDVIRTGTVTGKVIANAVGDGGVKVTLLNGSTIVATTATNASGTYTFANLVPGFYRVAFTAPTGQILQQGGTYGLNQSGSLTVNGGTVTTVATQTMFGPTNPMLGAIAGAVVINGAADSGVGIALVVGSTTIATTTTNSAGRYYFNNITPGVYRILFTSPALQVTAAGNHASFAGIGAQTVTAGQVKMFPTETSIQQTPVTLNGTSQSLAEAAGNYVLTGNATNSSVVLGNGDQAITMMGGNNTLSLGTGYVTVVLGAASAVHTTGGTSVIRSFGNGSVLDAGPGNSTYVPASGSTHDTFMFNGINQGLLTVVGYTTTGNDLLDLKRTLSGVSILPDMSNIGAYITSAATSAGTALYVDPTGGHGTPYEFGLLSGVQTSVADLLAHKDISLT